MSTGRGLPHGVANLNSKGEYRYKQTLPSTGSGLYNLMLTSIDEANNIAFFFYGKGAENTAATARLWGVSRISDGSGGDDYIGVWLADLDLVLGRELDSQGEFTANPKFRVVDKINVTDEGANTPPGIRLAGDIHGGFAMVMLDSMGFSNIIIELKKSATGTDIGMLWRVL